MQNKVIYDLVASIYPLDELERIHKKDALEWIASGVELCRLEKPATPPKHLVSYFALVDEKRRKLLLVDHKKALLWLLPGGHVDPGEHPLDAAHRECEEELGVSLPSLQLEPLFLSVTETVGLSAGHVDVSLWYLFKADSTKSYTWDAGEFNEIRWFPIDELPLAKSDPHMDRFRQKLEMNLVKTVH